MKTLLTSNSIGKTALIVVMAVVFASAFVPVRAHALSFDDVLDPFCVLRSSCNEPDNVTVNNTNSNNTNSNVNSPGGTVNVNNDGTPTYGGGGNNNNNNRPLEVNCYATHTRVYTGQNISWRASAYGGTGNYYYEWSGRNISGTGSSVDVTYYNTGTKNASVRVVSGNQSVTRNCGSVEVVRDNYNNDHYYNNDYYYNNNNYYDYNRYNDYYGQLNVTCSVNTSFTPVNQPVVWTAQVSGGNGSYSYSWSGSDTLRGSGPVVGVTYHDAGTKYGSVTVRSGNRVLTQSCTNSVTVGIPTGGYYPGTGSLDATCYVDRSRATVGTPITWSVNATGGTGSYTYSWSGTDNLTSNQSSVVIGYSSAGTKTGSVTIQSGGQSITRSCGSVIMTSGAASAPVVKAPTKPVDTDDRSSLSASAIFSLDNVPWGWVAILVILILFGTVVYLLMNKSKI